MGDQQDGRQPHWTEMPAPQLKDRGPGQFPKFTREELAVMEECRKESFWYRSVPMAGAGICLTTLATRAGILKPHPRFGALYKNMAVAALGYFAGKAAYAEQCAEKFLKLENSALGDHYRKLKQRREQARTGGYGDRDYVAPTESYQSGTTSQSSRVSSFGDYSSDISVDTYQNKQNKGLDDSNRPTLDKDLMTSRQEEKENKYTSYDELRKKNRETYQRSYQERVAPPTSSTDNDVRPAVARPPPVVSPPVSSPQSSGGRRNKYGDLIED